MAKKERAAALTTFDAREIIRKGDFTSEVDFERAVWTERALNLLTERHPELEALRIKVRDMLIKYESAHWSRTSTITKKQIRESDEAEKLVEKEFAFIKKRRELITKNLKKLDLNQNDLAKILAHSKSYTSELLSGTRSFSMNDLVIIHKLLDISLENLISTAISADVQKRIDEVFQKTTLKKSANKISSSAATVKPKTDEAKNGKSTNLRNDTFKEKPELLELHTL